MKQAETIQIARTGTMLDVSLLDHLKAQGAKTAAKVEGPNGAFISWTNQAGVRSTLPVGRNSQNGTLAEFKLMQTEPDADGVVTLIATVNDYKATEEITFN